MPGNANHSANTNAKHFGFTARLLCENFGFKSKTSFKNLESAAKLFFQQLGFERRLCLATHFGFEAKLFFKQFGFEARILLNHFGFPATICFKHFGLEDLSLQLLDSTRLFTTNILFKPVLETFLGWKQDVCVSI